MLKSLVRSWYDGSPWLFFLVPVSWLFCLLVWLRRVTYRSGLRRVYRAPVPVIVVGNITLGGTGKTPLVIWLADFLRDRGYRPGIVSRGYRGKSADWPRLVGADSDPALVGDEPVLLARRCACPVVVDPERSAAVRFLLARHDCDVVISDDGLQHYALARDIEIAVLDGARRAGNGFCLPAGPLREPASRLGEMDMVVINGAAGPGEYSMQLRGGFARNLADPQLQVPLLSFGGRVVHALAAIGRPERFFQDLEAAGLDIQAHEFPDHHAFRKEDLEFSDDKPVLMTEKDAVKVAPFANARFWVVPVSAELAPAFGQRVLESLPRG